ncbi:MAG: geranylgeranyl reductase family protein [Candidatus Micrarchaeota archaeon]
MENTAYDAVIVGGGPGGSTCAAFLGKMGHKVLLLEKQKFPRDKTCGDAISGKSRGVLRDLGIVDIVEAAPHSKVFGVAFSSPDGTYVDIPIPQDRGIDYGYCCRRNVYDDLLFQYAKKFATVIEEFEVTDVIKEGEKVVGVKGIDKGNGGVEKTFNGKVIAGADGALSIVARKLGVGEIDPKHNCTGVRGYFKGVKNLTKSIELHFVDSIIPGYFWIFPMEEGIANVGAGVLTANVQSKKMNLKEETLKIINENPVFKERFADAKQMAYDADGKLAEVADGIRGWNLPLGSAHRKVHGEGYVLLGDAASLIDPFSGEGIGNAMTSGKIAAAIIHKALLANDFSAKMLSEYEKNLYDLLWYELNNSWKMQKRGNNKWLVNTVLKKARNNKQLREFIGASLIDQHARQGFGSPLFYLKILLTPPLW